jgi:hypothetical protein
MAHVRATDRWLDRASKALYYLRFSAKEARLKRYFEGNSQEGIAAALPAVRLHSKYGQKEYQQ